VFQVEPILWLQSFDWPPLAWLLSGVTLLGYAPAYAALLLVLAFAVRLRPTLAVLGGLLLSGLVTEAFKDGVAYPRPDEIDSRVRKSFGSGPVQLHERGGAPDFWSAPRPEAVLAVRQHAGGNYGFPSGHVSAATAFVLCAAYFFRSRRILAFGAGWVPAMAVSRVYLGRHFLGDVLGGLAVGLASAAVALPLLRRLARGSPAGGPGERQAVVPLALLALGLVVAAPGARLVQPSYAGAVAGLAICWRALLARGFPPDGGTTRQGMRRVALAGLVFLGGVAVRQALLALAGHGLVARLTALCVGLAVTALTFAGSVVLCRRLGLYGPADKESLSGGQA
jgi:membrane-associated phospholipid phosphatase